MGHRVGTWHNGAVGDTKGPCAEIRLRESRGGEGKSLRARRYHERAGTTARRGAKGARRARRAGAAGGIAEAERRRETQARHGGETKMGRADERAAGGPGHSHFT